MSLADLQRGMLDGEPCQALQERFALPTIFDGNIGAVSFWFRAVGSTDWLYFALLHLSTNALYSWMDLF
jgi:hypothetical protein